MLHYTIITFFIQELWTALISVSTYSLIELFLTLRIRSFNRLSQIPVAMWNYLLHGSVPGMTSPDREFWLNDCLQAKVDNKCHLGSL